MAKSDDGHYELVLGNRQLVSGFFVLVILFAIFLTLGYILGRNSVVVGQDPSLSASNDIPDTTTAAPRDASFARPSATESTPVSQKPQPSVSEPLPTTTPVSETAVPEPAKPEPAKVQTVQQQPTVPAPKPATPAATPPAQRPSEAARGGSSGARVISPRKGDTFIQVAAIARADAEKMVQRLGERGHRAFLSEVPGKDLFRVLIGPFETAERLNTTKKKLEGEGLPTMVQRY